MQYNLTAQANYVVIPQLITDSPRLAYRAVMVDTGRTFISISQLRTLCNAMEAWRFNVLNIHLTDVQSWPLEITGLPDLSGMLSYRHETQRHVYSIADARNLTQHCLERGVRVVPEIDAPGHFPAAAAYPEAFAFGTRGLTVRSAGCSTSPRRRLGALSRRFGPRSSSHFRLASTTSGAMRWTCRYGNQRA